MNSFNWFIKKQSPSEKLEALERWSARATIIIFVGIVAEIAGAFLFVHTDVTLQEKAYYIGCNSLIAIALLIEYLCIVRAISTTRQLQTESDERVAVAEARSNEALAQLARYKAPRLFTVQQKEDIAQKLSQYAGTKFDMALNTNDPEMLDCITHIQIILINAGWEAVSWAGAMMVIQSPFGQQIGCGLTIRGISIGIPYSEFMRQQDAACMQLRNAACALATELQNVEGIEDIGFAPLMEPNQNNNTVHILVGRKT